MNYPFNIYEVRSNIHYLQITLKDLNFPFQNVNHNLNLSRKEKKNLKTLQFKVMGAIKKILTLIPSETILSAFRRSYNSYTRDINNY